MGPPIIAPHVAQNALIAEPNASDLFPLTK